MLEFYPSHSMRDDPSAVAGGAVPGCAGVGSGCLARTAAGAATGVSQGTGLTLLPSKLNPVPAGQWGEINDCLGSQFSSLLAGGQAS